MGTREVYEQKLRSGNLHHDPTINPGLGSARCPRCLSLINPNSKSGEWTITSVLHDATAVLCPHADNVCGCQSESQTYEKWWTIVHNPGKAGAGIGGMLSAVYGINTGIPYIQNRVRGPKWLPFLIGMPPLLMFSATCAALGGYALPQFAQLTVTSYYATSSASHYGISLLTRHIEEVHTAQSHPEKLR